MRITLAAIGKAKRGPEQQLFDEYVKRLKWKVTLIERESKSSLKKSEADLLSDAVASADYRIALDERGKTMTSVAFAKHISNLQVAGVNHIGFIIGGASGLHESIITKADLTLSLGAMTWPHMLVRALLAEQLYRAWSILNHHPYHRE